MDFGIFMGPTDETIRVDTMAAAVEELGFDSYWVPEHSHIPVGPATGGPGGSELPRGYKSGLEPWVALAAAAAATSRILLGTGCALVPEHDPIHLAKRIATVDLLSGGRVLVGVAAGWHMGELANHGINPAERWEIMQDRTQAMRAIWTSDEPEYHGSHVDFEPIWQWPKPVQKPHPPILVGGNHGRGMRHTVAYGDGWMPFVGREDLPMAQRLEQLNEMAAAAGRDPIPATVFGVRAAPDHIEQYLVPGVERIVIRLGPDPANEVLPQLGQAATLAAEYARE
jgi:probable F420-dependent oxidoreductase